MAELIRGDLITEEGRTIKFGDDTGRLCPNCGGSEKPNNLHIRVIIDNTATIECPSCGYYENVPKDTVVEMKDVKGRIIKPPKHK